MKLFKVFFFRVLAGIMLLFIANPLHIVPVSGDYQDNLQSNPNLNTEVESVLMTPGYVNISGYLRYPDRSSITKGAKGVRVMLVDLDPIGYDLIAETQTNSNGYYSFPSIWNEETDDTDPNLDLQVFWVLDYGDIKVSNSSEDPYYWYSTYYENISNGTYTISKLVDNTDNNLPAIWLFQDAYRARQFYLTSTSPSDDPGFLTIHWVLGQNSETLQGSHFIPCNIIFSCSVPHVYIADNSVTSADTIVHELGHHVMWNKTGQWLWYDAGCFDHQIFSQESTACGWSEGWADYFAVAVNGDACYDFGIGPCTGSPDNFDLENHTRNDPNTEGSWWGDGVEGRVAGALYDLVDTANESPFYDTADWDFDRIIAAGLSGSGVSSFYVFWLNDLSINGSDTHNGIRSIYQNTIDYDSAPVIGPIPDLNVLQNLQQTHVIDLWDYSSDLESQDTSLTYSIGGVTNLNCHVSLDTHWVNVHPSMNWIGSCFVTINVNDSIKSGSTDFWVVVLPITSRIYLPIIER